MELLGPNNQYLPKIVAVFAEVSFYTWVDFASFFPMFFGLFNKLHTCVGHLTPLVEVWDMFDASDQDACCNGI